MLSRLWILLRRYAPYLMLAVIALIGFALWHFWDRPPVAPHGAHGMERVAQVLLILLATAPLLAVIWFLYLFTGVDVGPGRIEQIILFCYLFTGIALVGSILPFLAFPFAPSLQQVMIRAPIGVTPGCKLYPISSDDKSELKELACGNRTDQWVINIGGIAELEATPQATEKSPAEASRERAPQRPATWPVAKVQGGLVVPLYVVVLSLMGAAVSMTRRVPEYQERLIPGTPDSITREQARQYLVFQVMQVVSAPMIAIVAYHMIEPETPKVSVLLGFISGFASETILLHILAATRKLTPSAPSVPAPAVSVSASMLKFGDQKVHTTSTPQVVIITNIGTARLAIGEIAQSDEFTHTLSGSSTLQPGASLAISLVFAPTSEGAHTGTLTIRDNAPGSPRTIVLSGMGKT
jgi:hypothetical protein